MVALQSLLSQRGIGLVPTAGRNGGGIWMSPMVFLAELQGDKGNGPLLRMPTNQTGRELQGVHFSVLFLGGKVWKNRPRATGNLLEVS